MLELTSFSLHPYRWQSDILTASKGQWSLSRNFGLGRKGVEIIKYQLKWSSFVYSPDGTSGVILPRDRGTVCHYSHLVTTPDTENVACLLVYWVRTHSCGRLMWSSKLYKSFIFRNSFSYGNVQYPMQLYRNTGIQIKSSQVPFPGAWELYTNQNKIKIIRKKLP